MKILIRVRQNLALPSTCLFTNASEAIKFVQWIYHCYIVGTFMKFLRTGIPTSISPISKYFFNISCRNLFLTENTRNPWFNEYLQVYHNCSYKPLDSKVSNCKLADTSNFRQQQYIHFIRDAVYAYAHAIHNLHKVQKNVKLI